MHPLEAQQLKKQVKEQEKIINALRVSLLEKDISLKEESNRFVSIVHTFQAILGKAQSIDQAIDQWNHFAARVANCNLTKAGDTVLDEVSTELNFTYKK
jgi:hypothetical protein